VGGTITTATAERVRAWAVCGGANNIVAEPAAERRLLERDISFVPDVVSSAGAVIDGISRRVMLLTDSTVLIDALGATAREILAESRRSGRTATEIAHERAREAIAQRQVPVRTR
jgi:leucine dehydrogenase